MSEGRAPLRVAVELSFAPKGTPSRDEEAPPPRCFRLAADVTASQLRFRSALPYREGTRLRLRFELPFDPPVTVQTEGVVQRALGRPSEVALGEVSGAAGEALSRYLDEERDL